MTITAEQAELLLDTGSANCCGNDLARALIASEAARKLAEERLRAERDADKMQIAGIAADNARLRRLITASEAERDAALARVEKLQEEHKKG